MRLWSLHPQYLDAKGLTALWREALLARKVLLHQTKKYKNHPQLDRFKNQLIKFTKKFSKKISGVPRNQRFLKYINTYLYFVYQESCSRGYCFDKTKLQKPFTNKKLFVTGQQLIHELKHLKNKLKRRNKERFLQIKSLKKPQPHPLFKIKKGQVESWERI